MAYVERNPVRARMVEQAEEFAWSSARARRTGERGMVDLAAWRAAYDWQRWREVLETSLGEEAFGERLQEASRRGRPLGGEEFTEELERRCGRRLRALPVGRPRKSGAQEERQMVWNLVFECAVPELPELSGVIFFLDPKSLVLGACGSYGEFFGGGYAGYSCQK